jgi:hypothetical protein
MEKQIFDLATEAYEVLAANPTMPISEQEKIAVQKINYLLGQIIGLTNPKSL